MDALEMRKIGSYIVSVCMATMHETLPLASPDLACTSSQ